jgi:DNA-binding beta-propeller fold protein YncE
MTARSLALALAFFVAAASPALADKLVVVAGGGDGPDGSPAATAKLVAPFGIDFAPDGALYFVEMAGGERLRLIDSKGILHTLAGTGMKGSTGDGGPGLKATFNGMHSLAVGADGLVYLADTWNHRIRTYDPKTGIVAAFAGTGEKGFGGDGGTAEKATFGDVYCLAFDEKKENMYIADLDNRRIRKIDMRTRIVTTYAGNGQKGVPKDLTFALKSPLFDPRAVAAGRDGRVYILERSGHALRLADSVVCGTISTVAGTGTAGATLDEAAKKVQFNGPKHLCMEYRDGSEYILVADSENHRILRFAFSPGKPLKAELVAGTGKKGSAIVDGDPLKSQLAQPHGVAVHPKTGEIYVADSSNNRILKIAK